MRRKKGPSIYNVGNWEEGGGRGQKLVRTKKLPTWGRGAHCTEIDFALSFGAVIVKIIDLTKTESRDFFGII